MHVVTLNKFNPATDHYVKNMYYKSKPYPKQQCILYSLNILHKDLIAQQMLISDNV